MKKIIGYIGAYSFYWIGDLFCKISYIKVRGQYVFDKKPLTGIGDFLAEAYQRSMGYSWRIQDWAKLDKPWVKVPENEQ